MQTSAAAQTEKLLAAMWNKNLPMIKDRLQLLDRAAETARSTSLTGPLRREAAMTAHKLAGSLGMFGYREGTELARKLELILDHTAKPDANRLCALSADLRRSLKL